MMNEELAVAGLPAEPAAQNPETVQPPEEHPSPADSESRSHEEGEVRTDDEDVGDVDEDVGDVDADVKDLIRIRPAGPLPPCSSSGNPSCWILPFRNRACSAG
jgi:hypothetical protein